jgi:diguanylate cyclase (GGDEF)-like protein
MVTTQPADARAEEDARALRGTRAQRLLLAGGGAAFVGLSVAIFPPDDALGFASLGGVSAGVLGLAFVRTQHARFPALLLPLAAALIFSLGIVANAMSDPAPDVVRFALMSGLLAPFLSLLAPTRRGALAALIAMSAVTAGGALLVATQTSSFDAVPALVFLLAALALALAASRALENSRIEAIVLRGELERRATSDEITGVSNRAHVSLLAQNEFARARRYGEPFACLAIEIDGYEQLLAVRGRSALTAIVQVFTGYCVVVMRHCDSFGRLTPSRFLALLPETPAAGAYILAKRMCGDLADLTVAFGGDKIHFTVSIGVTDMHPVDRGAGDMLRRGEQGLADAIERGGSCAVFANAPASPQAGDAPQSVDGEAVAPP